MGYDYQGNRMKSQQKTVKPPEGLTPRQTEKWLNEQAILFEKSVKNQPVTLKKNITLAQYIEIFKNEVAPIKHSKSTQTRNKIEYERILPYLGHIKLKDLKAEDFRNFYAEMRKVKSKRTGELLAEASIEGLHSVVCSILSSAMEQGYITHNPAWRTYKPQGMRKEKVVADEETVQKILSALEQESIKYEVYFKIIIATGIRRGECCGIKWEDINFTNNEIRIQRNVVKVQGEEVFTKPPKTVSGNRYVYFSDSLASLLKDYKDFCTQHIRMYENRQMTDGTYLFRQNKTDLPMIPDTFSSRFRKILRDNNLPTSLNVHSLRHTTASLLIANGTDVATVASLLGHAQVSTTLDIYTHAFDKNRKKAAEGLHKGLGV
ncbi:site-specific integrase [Hydrogenoanaerobacterium sp.]|uniref:tyrosine-type recombinase/integrase n=1 Tax=Hydrogenoanaerobacterium sp. TaxID=2953763 RepID=UPI00289ACBDE|nr:site-specific integrase [Hydrogenoanaerobacterium sp.]